MKSLVATAYIDCTACAPCKQLCVEYTTFARKATYFVRIVQFFYVSDLLCTYRTCAFEATCAYDVLLVRVKRLIVCIYSTAIARKRLMSLKRLVRTMYDFCAWQLLPPVPTVSFVRSEIVRMTCRTK